MDNTWKIIRRLLSEGARTHIEHQKSVLRDEHNVEFSELEILAAFFEDYLAAHAAENERFGFIITTAGPFEFNEATRKPVLGNELSANLFGRHRYRVAEGWAKARELSANAGDYDIEEIETTEH